MWTASKFLIPALAAGLAASFAAGVPAQAGKTAAATEKPAEEAAAKKKKRRSSCAFRRSINGFSVIDDKHFILEAGTRDFLVTLSPGCHHLKFNMAIGIKSTPAAGICVERGDRVLLDDHFTCWIRDIEPVENKEEARKLVAERTKPKDEDDGNGDADGGEDKTPD